MKKRLVLSLFTFAIGIAACDGYSQKKLKLTSASHEAKEAFYQSYEQIALNNSSEARSIVEKALKADPDFAMALALKAELAPFSKRVSMLDAALAKKSSGDEEMYIQARQQYFKREYEESVNTLKPLHEKFPDDPMVAMALGLASRQNGDHDGALKAFEAAKRITGGTPRVDQLIISAKGALYVMQERYGEARDFYQNLISKYDRDSSPNNLFMAMAWTHIYEENREGFREVMADLMGRYNRNGAAQSAPPVWMWNHIGKVMTEMGDPGEGFRNFETGYKSVPPSHIDSTLKLVWLGRSIMGKGRALAKMGRHKEAWEHAERIKKIIDDGGEQGERYLPAYHYMVGYLKLEADEYQEAIEHLLQASLGNPFHKLLLARAYYRAGEKENAYQAYKEVAGNRGNSLDRALSAPEAKKMLAKWGTD